MRGRGHRGDEPLLACLAAGKTVAEAACTAGLSEATCYRRLGDAGFQSRLSETRAAVLSRAVGMLTELALAAVAAMQASLGAESEGVRLRAAVAVLDQVVRLRASEDLERRLTALERAQGGREPAGTLPPLA